MSSHEWISLLATPSRRATAVVHREVQQAQQKWSRAIQSGAYLEGLAGVIYRDVRRTLPEIPMFKGKHVAPTPGTKHADGYIWTAGHGQLFAALVALDALRPHVGYCQGMNFVAAQLLAAVYGQTTPPTVSGGAMDLVRLADGGSQSKRMSARKSRRLPGQAIVSPLRMDELHQVRGTGSSAEQQISGRPATELVVLCLLTLVDGLGCADVWNDSLAGVQQRCWMLERCVQDYLPEVAAALEASGMPLRSLAAQWVVPLLGASLPPPAFAAVMHRMAVHGWAALFAAIVGLLRASRAALAEAGMVEVAQFMRDWRRLVAKGCRAVCSSGERGNKEGEEAYNDGSSGAKPALASASGEEGRDAAFVASCLQLSRGPIAAGAADQKPSLGKAAASTSDEESGSADPEEARLLAVGVALSPIFDADRMRGLIDAELEACFPEGSEMGRLEAEYAVAALRLRLQLAPSHVLQEAGELARRLAGIGVLADEPGQDGTDEIVQDPKGTGSEDEKEQDYDYDYDYEYEQVQRHGIEQRGLVTTADVGNGADRPRDGAGSNRIAAESMTTSNGADEKSGLESGEARAYGEEVSPGAAPGSGIVSQVSWLLLPISALVGGSAPQSQRGANVQAGGLAAEGTEAPQPAPLDERSAAAQRAAAAADPTARRLQFDGGIRGLGLLEPASHRRSILETMGPRDAESARQMPILPPVSSWEGVAHQARQSAIEPPSPSSSSRGSLPAATPASPRKDSARVADRDAPLDAIGSRPGQQLRAGDGAVPGSAAGGPGANGAAQSSSSKSARSSSTGTGKPSLPRMGSGRLIGTPRRPIRVEDQPAETHTRYAGNGSARAESSRIGHEEAPAASVTVEPSLGQLATLRTQLTEINRSLEADAVHLKRKLLALRDAEQLARGDFVATHEAEQAAGTRLRVLLNRKRDLSETLRGAMTGGSNGSIDTAGTSHSLDLVEKAQSTGEDSGGAHDPTPASGTYDRADFVRLGSEASIKAASTEAISDTTDIQAAGNASGAQHALEVPAEATRDGQEYVAAGEARSLGARRSTLSAQRIAAGRDAVRLLPAAKVRELGRAIAEADRGARAASDTWQRSLWRHTIASTRLEEIVLARTALAEQLAALTQSAEAGQDDAIRRAWRRMCGEGGHEWGIRREAGSSRAST